MGTTRRIPTVVFLIAAILVSIGFAGAPMGPPMATLEEGQWGMGAEYGYEQIDLEGCGIFDRTLAIGEDVFADSTVESLEIEDLETNMIFGHLAYGLTDDWDVFVRFGGADARDDATGTTNVVDTSATEDYSLGEIDSDFGFAGGVGTRTTFYHAGPWRFGGLAQVTWFDPDDSEIQYTEPLAADPDLVHSGMATLEYWQVQVSLAAIYQVDTWSFWGGPFMQFVDGDFERSGTAVDAVLGDVGEFSADTEIEQVSWLGAHFGANWNAADQWDLWVEGQVTGDSWLVGVGAVFLPEDAFGG